MKKFSQRTGAVAALLALAAVSQAAHAQSKAGTPSTGYAEIGYLAATHKEAGVTTRPASIRLLAGAEVIPGLAVEGMLGFKAKSGESGTTSVDHNTLVGVYLTPRAELAPGLSAFARLGATHLAQSTTLGTNPATDTSGNSASYGIGLTYLVGSNVTAGVDYMSYFDRNNIKMTGFTASIGVRF